MKKSIFMALALVISLSIGCRARTLGLFVGIQYFKDNVVEPVYSSYRDADDIYQLYKLYKPNGSYLQLMDAEATTTNIISGLERQCSAATEQDTLVLAMCTHGYKGGIMTYDSTLSNNTIHEIMHKCSAKRKMVIVLACHSGSMMERETSDSKKEATWSGMMHKPNQSKSEVVVLTSSRPGQFSYGSRDANSQFGYRLLQGLLGGADANDDGIISIREIYDYLREIGYFCGQTPQLKGRFDENSPFI